MTWFQVSVTWDEDNAYFFAVEAQDEEHARLIALANAPSPTATVTNRLLEEDVDDDSVMVDFDYVIPLGGEA